MWSERIKEERDGRRPAALGRRAGGREKETPRCCIFGSKEARVIQDDDHEDEGAFMNVVLRRRRERVRRKGACCRFQPSGVYLGHAGALSVN